MSLVEQAIAKMREATATAKAASAEVAPVAVPAPRAKSPVNPANPANPANLENTARNSRVLVVDHTALRANGYLPEVAVEQQFAEQYRQIKRPLIDNAFVGKQAAGGIFLDPRIIMVSSALPGEGKTFTSINLAFSMARERDMSVVLVDADVLKPQISNVLGVSREPGLMDVLIDEHTAVESFVLRTDVRGLSVLPAGKSADGSAELLVSNRMRQALGELLAENPRRVILLDCPPLLATSEGRALTKVAGQVILVVREGKTPELAVKDSVALFEAKRMGGIVLNDAHLSLTQSLYGYGPYTIQGNDKNT